MTHVRFDYSKALTFFNEHELTYLRDFVKTAHHNIHEKTGAGSDFLGWVDLPEHYDKEEFARIKKARKKSNLILMYCLLSASAVLTLGRGLRLKRLITRFIILCQKQNAAIRKLFSSEITSVHLI